MKNFLSNKYFQLSIRFILGVVFLYAALGKLFNPEGLAKAILRYEFLPVFFVNLQAIIMPWLELTLAVFLIFGIYKKGTSLLTSAVIVMFLIALISAYARGLDISCGCFSLEETSTKGDILIRIFQDIFMLLGSVIVYMFCETKEPVTSIKENEIIKGDKNE